MEFKVYKADILLMRKDLDQAQIVLDELIEAEPDLIEIRFRLGRLYAMQKKYRL